jgi:DNA-binding transcriptional MerR regulator
MSERMYGTAVVAERLGLKIQTLRAWARAGLVPAGRTRGGARYLWSDDQIREIAALLCEGQVAEADELCHA